MHTIGIVTVTYNSGLVIDDFLRSLLAQTYRDFILYIVDNASSDRTLSLVNGYNDPRICIIANSGNLGIAKANNQGITLALSAGCNYVLLVNNDTEFGPALLATLVTGMETHAADMTAPKILFHHDQEVIWSAGG